MSSNKKLLFVYNSDLEELNLKNKPNRSPTKVGQLNSKMSSKHSIGTMMIKSKFQELTERSINTFLSQQNPVVFFEADQQKNFLFIKELMSKQNWRFNLNSNVTSFKELITNACARTQFGNLNIPAVNLKIDTNSAITPRLSYVNFFAGRTQKSYTRVHIPRQTNVVQRDSSLQMESTFNLSNPGNSFQPTHQFVSHLKKKRNTMMASTQRELLPDLNIRSKKWMTSVDQDSSESSLYDEAPHKSISPKVRSKLQEKFKLYIPKDKGIQASQPDRSISVQDWTHTENKQKCEIAKEEEIPNTTQISQPKLKTLLPNMIIRRNQHQRNKSVGSYISDLKFKIQSFTTPDMLDVEQRNQQIRKLYLNRHKPF